MDTLSTCCVEETDYMRSEEEEDEEEEDEEEEKDTQSEESAVGKQQKPAWAPSFFHRVFKEVYNYVGQEIVITEGLDSYAGMIWPAALALCHHLDTHREQLTLVDKAVLEIGAGTGLVSVVAALLGAWVTATDLPEVLSNLTVNLCRNTKGRCRHTPQVAALSWGYDLQRTYPSSVHRYDYVLAADVVYHHDFLDELLATMKHFCRPGTALIWANKVRFETDLTFTENFKNAFHTSLLAEDGEMKIFMATSREGEEEEDQLMKEDEGETEEEEEEESKEKHVEQKLNEPELDSISQVQSEGKENENVTQESDMSAVKRGKEKEEKNEHESDEEQAMGKMEILKEDERARDEPEDTDSREEDITGDSMNQTAVQEKFWVSKLFNCFDKDIYHYAGHDILIRESIDSYGAVMWPAALALCSFLDNNRHVVNLQGKEVLELGAGTGVVTVVASLLGASVTATDLPEVLTNLQVNVTRNTEGRCRHTPQVAALSWGYDLQRTYPSSVHRYDYVLAADVVYHHDFLDELLATMKHFCRPGTALIWANKVRFETDLTFTENFKNAFHTSLLAEDGEMKILMATSRE